MGIHDRDYYRKDRRSGRDVLAWFETPVGLLLGLNIGCYVLQIIGGPEVTSFLAASADSALGWGFWKLLTANFAHADEPMHLVGNMFFLWVLGREVETVYSRRDFYTLYLGAGVLAVLVELLVLRFSGRGHVAVLGASGAVMAIVVVCALLYPTRIVHVMFFLPAPLWLLCVLFLLLDLSGAVRGGTDVAHFAHLTGAVFGLAYQRLDLRWGQWSPRGAGSSRQRRAKVKIIPMTRQRESPAGAGDADPISERVDALLAKISSQGKESLTPEEWEFLKASFQPLPQLMTHDEIADRTIAWAVDAPQVRALWLEGDSLPDLRRPYGKLRFHLAADEPDYPALLAVLLAGPPWLPQATVRGVADTRRFAKELTIEAGGASFTLIAEQSYLLAKRPRAEVVPLVDKTGHLTHVMDFSLRGSP